MPGQVKTTKRLRWLEISKALALLLIVLNHALERMDEYPLIANPASDWAPFADRVSQLSPTSGSAWDLVFNALRYPGLFGEVGVQIFIIASGLGLTLSAMRRRGTGRGFLRRRMARIAPLWIVVHLLALLASVPILLFIGGGASDLVAAPWDARFWASMAGFRITPETIYYLVPSWWFIALLIQLYLVFPTLYRWFVRLGPNRYWYVIGGAMAVKLAGLLYFDTYLDAWSRGAIFITRLPEFAFGMLVAAWLSAEEAPLKRPWVLGAALVAIPVGIVSSLTLVGNAWGPFVYGAGLFVVLYRLLADQTFEGKIADAAVWTGRHSLALFVVHQPVVFVLLPGGMAGPGRVLGGLVAAVGITVVGALILEAIVARVERIWYRWSQGGVVIRRVGTIAVVALLAYGTLVAADLWVRANDPQEVLGWGERPSLVADDALGWKLAPSQTTRLQWQSYDYEVTSNQFGFPGPVDPAGSSDLKILTLGDAFTSAEGVHTQDAWPRLLERLAQQPVAVWNGAITGFGPPQYATAAQQLTPAFEPDIVVVGFFVNDFFGSTSDLEEAQEKIGFGRPDPTGVVPSLQWGHLSRYLRYRFTEPALALLGVPNRTGYLMGHFDAFEPGKIDHDTEGYRGALEAMTAIRSLAGDARVVVMLVPSSIQVCQPAALDYFPDNVNLDDFDLDQPQRMAASMAEATGMEVLDLRSAFLATGECLYQPGNMHWLEEGHEIAAATLVEYLDL